MFRFFRRSPGSGSNRKFTFTSGGDQARTHRVRASVKNFKKIKKKSGEVLLFRDREVQIHRGLNRRSIGLTLQVNGRIRISAPKSISLSHIKAFLATNSSWIETHLERYRTLREAYPPKRFIAGEKFLYMGQRFALVYRAGRGAHVDFETSGDELIVSIPESRWNGFDPLAPHPELAVPLARFYESEGRAIIGARLGLYSRRMALRPASVCFRSQKTRWGSCSVQGKISLNWRLIVAPLDVIDYVVVHELSHLRHYDHSRMFWELVSHHLPSYLELRQWLRDHQYEADFLARTSELHG